MSKRYNTANVLQLQWEVGLSPDLAEFVGCAKDVDAALLSRLVRIDQAERWLRDERPSSEEYLSQWPQIRESQEFAADLIYHEYLLRMRFGESPTVENFTYRFPQYSATLSEQIEFHSALIANGWTVNSEICENAEPYDFITNGHLRAQFPLSDLPTWFGRYEVLRLIGRGGMGFVYEAIDSELNRRVALKLSRFRRSRSEGAAERLKIEARTAATFRHPNLCPVYDIGELDGVVFITMPYVEGQSLAQHLKTSSFTTETALNIALKIAYAISAAHAAGIVHRDLKPANIILTDNHEPIVVDFGLAKHHLQVEAENPQPETMAGTLAYMAPEQLAPSNEALGPPSDVYALGTTLFEMLTGRPPFTGDAREIYKQIQTEPPPRPSSYVAKLPPAVDAICQKALAKSSHERFQSMAEFADALEAVVHPRPSRIRLSLVACALTLLLGAWLTWRATNISWARRQLPVVAKLAQENRLKEAFDLAVRVRKGIPHDRALARLMPVVSDTLTVTSQPEGAKVYIERLANEHESRASARVFVGTTPLKDFEIARGSYLVTVEKEGYSAFQRSWSGTWSGPLSAPIVFPPIPIDVNLTPETELSGIMASVPGGDYRLMSWSRPTEKRVTLDDFLIDKREVTNHDYQRFVDAGGYTTARYWTRPFVEKDKNIPLEEAISRFRDQTGQPGPRGWSQGTYPVGSGDLPVTGVTWYEAAAYAEFSGKSLPTIFQWEKAARFRWVHPGLSDFNNPMGVTMPWGLHEGSLDRRANFGGAGPVSTGQFPFGMSPYGCFDMAGNVAEWCLNETPEGFTACGGSWASIPSAWGLVTQYPGFHANNQVGFRCVTNRAGSEDQGAFRIDDEKEAPQFTPKPYSEIAPYFSYFNYPALPLESRVINTKISDSWRRETIEYRGADGEITLAYLYLPKQGQPPFPVLHVVPAGDVYYRIRNVPESIEASYLPILESGRAIFAVVLRGYLERDYSPDGLKPSPESIEHVEMLAQHVKDLRRGVDFLETRNELDTERIAYITTSSRGLLMSLPAIEPRYQAVIFVGNGVYEREQKYHVVDNGVNLAPHIAIPKLMIHGLYDENAPWKIAGEPLFDLFTEPKEKHFYPGAHALQPQELANAVIQWLDKLPPRLK